MSKKGQLVRGKQKDAMYVVTFGAPLFDDSVWVISLRSGREYLMPNHRLTLIGNNYKEKLRD